MTILTAANRENKTFKIALLIGMILISIRLSILNDHNLQSNVGQRIQFQGKVISDPNLKAANAYGSSWRGAKVSFLMRLEVFSVNDKKFKSNLPVRILAPENLAGLIKLGDLLTGNAKVVKTKELRVAALLVTDADIKVKKNENSFLLLADSIRKDFQAVIPKSDAGSLIPGIVLGDTSLQSDYLTKQMRQTGLSHLTAVSGANFALVAAFVLWLISFLRINLKTRFSIVALVLIFYIVLVRPTPSVLRAAVMTGVYLFARATGERSKTLAALGFAISTLIVFEPFQANDPGFALSVSATLGLIIFAPVLKKRIHKFLPNDFLAESISVPISATIFTLPIIVVMANKFSPFSVIANLFAAIVIAPITILGFCAALISIIFPTFSQFIVWVLTPLSKWLVLIASSFAALPAIEFENHKFALVLFLILGYLLFKRSFKVIALLITLPIFLIVVDRLNWPGGHWQVASCDVGQGDAMVLALPKHSAVLIDTGPDSEKIESCLRKLHIKEISLLVLTHFHADHVAALDSVIRNHQIKQAWITNQYIPEFSANRTKELLSQIPTRNVFAGDMFKIANLEIQVLWPLKSQTQFSNLPGDGSAANNSSIALLVKTAKYSLFACGDLEPEAQSELLNRFKISKVQIFKVCHHGSKSQDWHFIQMLNPKISLISAGIANQYGHPAAETVAGLLRMGSEIARTDKVGSISIGPGNKIHLLGKQWWQIRWR
jgi:competence protein ComEC